MIEPHDREDSLAPHSGAPASQPKRQRIRGHLAAALLGQPYLLYGVYLFCIGIVMYLLGVALVLPRYLLSLYHELTPISEFLVWYSGLPLVLGLAVAMLDLLVLFDGKRRLTDLRTDDTGNGKVTVALTAYDDEESIAEAVRDFLGHPLVARVIVVSNNSRDRTAEFAEAAGAIVFNEAQAGYGRCVYRCLTEAVKFEDTEFVVLCEGDRTFRSRDIDKLIAYAPHADIVNGTRTVEVLRERHTQLTTFMFYGNLFVGKLLEAKHLGASTITDVGSTYKLCRKNALSTLIPRLSPAVNLEFNAHFMDTALQHKYLLLECPVTFHARVGTSKGGNTDNLRALAVGLRMIRGLTFGWRAAT